MSNKQPSRTVLITGGAGYIGSSLSSHMVSRGYKVRIFDALFFGKLPILSLKKHVEIIQGDIRKPPSKLFTGIGSVIHLAALSNDPTAEFNPVANMQINTEGATIIARAARQAGVRRFVFASSCSIYDMGIDCDTKIKNEESPVFPRNPYSLSKYLAEQSILALQNNSFSVTVLRKGTVHGFSKRLRYDLIVNAMVRDGLQNGTIKVFCKGRQWRPLIAIEDVVEAYRLILELPVKQVQGQIFNISQDNYLVKDVAFLVKEAFQKNFGKIIEILYEQNNKSDRSYRVSTEKAKKVLGFNPTRTITHTVSELVNTLHVKKRYAHFNSPIFYNIEKMRPILQDLASKI